MIEKKSLGAENRSTSSIPDSYAYRLSRLPSLM